jgi:hypothetical protein
LGPSTCTCWSHASCAVGARPCLSTDTVTSVMPYPSCSAVPARCWGVHQDDFVRSCCSDQSISTACNAALARCSKYVAMRGCPSPPPPPRPRQVRCPELRQLSTCQPLAVACMRCCGGTLQQHFSTNRGSRCPVGGACRDCSDFCKWCCGGMMQFPFSKASSAWCHGGVLLLIPIAEMFKRCHYP